jgi:hypothetical protein
MDHVSHTSPNIILLIVVLTPKRWCIKIATNIQSINVNQSGCCNKTDVMRAIIIVPMTSTTAKFKRRNLWTPVLGFPNMSLYSLNIQDMIYYYIYTDENRIKTNKLFHDCVVAHRV